MPDPGVRYKRNFPAWARNEFRTDGAMTIRVCELDNRIPCLFQLRAAACTKNLIRTLGKGNWLQIKIYFADKMDTRAARIPSWSRQCFSSLLQHSNHSRNHSPSLEWTGRAGFGHKSRCPHASEFSNSGVETVVPWVAEPRWQDATCNNSMRVRQLRTCLAAEAPS